MKAKMPDPNSIGDDTLLRLGVAAALEFPDGSMGVSGLRREGQQGRLSIWRIAGKDYTTKRALREMRGQCVLSSHHDSNYGAPEKAVTRSGSSKIVNARSARALAKASAAKLRSRSRNTSSAIGDQASATVIPIKS
jgi:hypothetical protein